MQRTRVIFNVLFVSQDGAQTRPKKIKNKNWYFNLRNFLEFFYKINKTLTINDKKVWRWRHEKNNFTSQNQNVMLCMNCRYKFIRTPDKFSWFYGIAYSNKLKLQLWKKIEQTFASFNRNLIYLIQHLFRQNQPYWIIVSIFWGTFVKAPVIKLRNSRSSKSHNAMFSVFVLF